MSPDTAVPCTLTFASESTNRCDFRSSTSKRRCHWSGYWHCEHGNWCRIHQKTAKYPSPHLKAAQRELVSEAVSEKVEGYECRLCGNGFTADAAWQHYQTHVKNGE
ncbi:MAG: hypothetical protein JWN45_3072 [Acidobacteriaceae bacterium]|nr:hypothetical protein [Acidobacteriaceae bacterium]